MDVKFGKRFKSYGNSLESLTEARQRDMTDSFVLSGTSAKFCITFDLAWKVMKDILIQQYGITDFVAGSPKEVLKTAFRAQIIDDDVWMEMLKIRNQLTHDYDGEIIKEYCHMIVDVYVEKLHELKETVEKIIKSEKDRSE